MLWQGTFGSVNEQASFGQWHVAKFFALPFLHVSPHWPWHEFFQFLVALSKISCFFFSTVLAHNASGTVSSHTPASAHVQSAPGT
jgi:hypothetical protein